MPNPVQTTWLQPGLYPVEPIPYTSSEEPTQQTWREKHTVPDYSWNGKHIGNKVVPYRFPNTLPKQVINTVASATGVMPYQRLDSKGQEVKYNTGIAPVPTFMENPLSTAAIDAQVAKGIAEIKQAPNLKAITAAKNALLNMLKKTGKGGKNSHEAMLVKTAATDASTVIRDNQAAARAASEAAARTTGYVPKEYRPWTFKEQVLHGNGEIPTAYIEGGLKFH